MGTPTLIQAALACVFAILGFEGFWVSIHPPKSPPQQRVYLAAFAILTVLGVSLIWWQLVLGERAEAESEKATAELRRQISALYDIQVRVARRPTQDEVNALADRVYVLTRDIRFAGHGLRQDARLLAAEILHFAAERSRTAPPIETFTGSEGASSIVDQMKVPPVTRPLTDAEKLDEANRRLQTTWFDPLGQIGVSAEEKQWLQRNRASIDYHFQTTRIFSKRFSTRIAVTVKALQGAGVMEKWVAQRALTDYQYNELGMRELAFRLTESAEKLPPK
jgi:hypothetical protein